MHNVFVIVEGAAQARAFDSFESGDRRGAGLGMALVRSFVEMHGGWVALKSEPGRGVTVTCHLPRPSPRRHPPANAVAGSGVGASVESGFAGNSHSS
jgi:hypothetical protein